MSDEIKNVRNVEEIDDFDKFYGQEVQGSYPSLDLEYTTLIDNMDAVYKHIQYFNEQVIEKIIKNLSDVKESSKEAKTVQYLSLLCQELEQSKFEVSVITD